MGRPFIEYLEGGQSAGRIYCCRHCRLHLCAEQEILSKSFHAKSGRAYLFNACINTSAAPAEERLMTTGLHQVAELSCRRCSLILGWRYEMAYERSQKYKEGKVLIERACVCTVVASEDGSEDSSEDSEPEDY